jgi:hypothetical protein
MLAKDTLSVTLEKVGECNTQTVRLNIEGQIKKSFVALNVMPIRLEEICMSKIAIKIAYTWILLLWPIFIYSLIETACNVKKVKHWWLFLTWSTGMFFILLYYIWV